MHFIGAVYFRGVVYKCNSSQISGAHPKADSFEVTKMYYKNRGQANDRSRAGTGQ
jgi:hypothetical protein